MRIRKAAADDAPSLVPLVESYWALEGIAGFDPQRVAHELQRLLGDPRLGCGLIAFEDTAAVGYLLAVYVFSLEHLGLTAEIDEFFVVPQHRSHGAGAALLRTAEEIFVAKGCTNVSLQLSRGNEAARVFYRRHGYQERSGYELLDKTLRDG